MSGRRALKRATGVGECDECERRNLAGNRCLKKSYQKWLEMPPDTRRKTTLVFFNLFCAYLDTWPHAALLGISVSHFTSLIEIYLLERPDHGHSV